ncbi:unnamed protein product [Auanema sp. JU1783]|nr:unnamed protein product [Auanema sp. JU1783]
MDVDRRSCSDLDCGRFEFFPLKTKFGCSTFVYETAVLDVARNDEIFSGQEIMEFERKIKKDGQKYISLADLVSLLPAASKALRRAFKFIVSHPYEFTRGINFTNEDRGLFSCERICSFLYWYQMKCTQRTSLINFAADVDEINIERLYELADQLITDKMAFLSSASNIEKKCYDVIIKAGIMTYFGSRDNIRIVDLLLSNLLDEACFAADVSNADDLNVNPLMNWFSYQSFSKILKEYRFCDISRQGLLRVSDTSRMFGGIFNPVFIRGVFRTSSTYETEPDSKGAKQKALDFHLFVTALRAVRYISSVFPNEVSITEKTSVRYVFNCLDEDVAGYLTRQNVLHIVYNNIENAKTLNFIDDVDEESLTDEIFDMVNPELEDRITVNDLFRSRQANLILGIMIDARQFVDYENREAT